MKNGQETVFKGIAASSGFAIGYCALGGMEKIEISTQNAGSKQEELDILEKARLQTVDQLEQIAAKVRAEIGEDEAQVFESHILMVNDPEYLDMIRLEISQNNCSVTQAIQAVTKAQVVFFQELQDEYFQARAVDIQDVADRLIRNSLGTSSAAVTLPEDAIVVAKDLTPSDTALLDRTRVRAFLTEAGSKTSHSAIMARGMGIPAVLGLETLCAQVAEGMLIIVDGFEGIVFLNPTQARVEEYRKKHEEYSGRLQKLQIFRNIQLTYLSGRTITVAGNIGSVEEMDELCKQGSQGVGLFRTEFLFMGRTSMPSEDEQFIAYKSVAQKAEGASVVIRTLDIGGDKVIPYLNMPKEDNPFLGLRALRLCFEEKEIFKAQIKALLRAAVYGNVHIMFPMISALDELRQAKGIVEECKRELLADGVAFHGNTPIGMMIEIPAAAVMARSFAKEVDFFSIGTNDLVQYTLAVDRMNSKVAHLYNPFHPAVIELIRTTIEAAHEAGIWCGMCGEFAADLNATQLLAQLELDEFSVSASYVLIVKEQLLAQANVRKLI